MRRFILMIITLATVLCGCQKEDIAELPSGSEDRESVVTFNLFSENIDVIQTKALTPERERCIQEANIYCFNTVTGKCQWVYMTGTTAVNMKLTEGIWDVYVTANNGRFQTDNRAEVEKITHTIVSESDLEKNNVLPMQTKTRITVRGNMKVPITLTRIVAKVNVSVTVAAALRAKIRLQSISLKNVPGNCTYFKNNTPTSGMINYSERSCTNGTATSFYMLENCQGTNNAISDQRYKGRENAPKSASYLHIKAATDDELLDYYIYLGANNTTDFNVEGNKNYVVNINITGINETDWRVSVVEIPKNISVSLTCAHYKETVYLPVEPGVGTVHAGADRDITVTVNLSRPSRRNVRIGVLGAIYIDGIPNLYIDYNATSGAGERLWPTDYLVTIPAGSTSATKQLSKLKFRQGGIMAGFPSPSHCLIREVVKESGDVNNYLITSMDEPFSYDVEHIKSYPKD